MGEKKLVFDIGANFSDTQKSLSHLRAEFDATINALKSRSGEITLFKAAQQDAAKLEAQIAKLGKAGGDTSGLTTALNAQRSALAQQAAGLQKAGVNTNALTSEQARLRVQADQVSRTFRTQSAVLKASNGFAAGLASFRNILGSLGIAFGAFQVVQFTKGIIEAKARLFELNQITGINVPTLNGLAFAAKQSGTDIESVAKGVGLLSKVVTAAKDPASEQAKLLGQWGIDGKTAEVALLQIADLFASMPDGLEKDNRALKLFGRAGRELIPMLNGGGVALRAWIEEANKLDPTTKEMVKQAHETEDAVGRLTTAFKGLGSTLITKVSPSLTQYIAAFNDIVKNGSALDRLKFFSVGFISPEVLARIKAADEATAALLKKPDDAQLTASFALHKKQSEDLVKIKEFETSKIKDALDKQEKAYQKSNDAISKTEDDRVNLAKKNAERLLAITNPEPSLTEKSLVLPELTSTNLDANAAARNEAFRNQAEARNRVNQLRVDAAAGLAKAITVDDFEKVVALGEKAAAIIVKLNEAKASSPSELAAQQKAIADLQDKALQGKAVAEQAIASKNLAIVDATKAKLKDFEEKPFVVNGKVDFPTAKANIAAAMAAMQADLDAKPLRVEVIPVVKPALAQGIPNTGEPQIAWGKHAAGIVLAGYGGGDRRPVLVEDGEAITRKEAVRYYGPDFMRALNSMALERYAQGGIVERSVSSLPSISASSSGMSSKAPITLVLDGNSYRMEASDSVADSLQAAIRTAALKHGRRR